MAIQSAGYDGTVDERQFADLASFLGADYAVKDANDLKVTAVVGLDRTVRVAVGTGYGHGVRDVSDSTVDIQLGTIASGSRWDLIAARRNWQPPGGATTFVAVAGTSAQEIPAGRLATPGVQDDQPLALVQVTAGQTTPTAVLDLRAQASKIVRCQSLLAIPAPRVGMVARVGAGEFEYVIGPSGTPLWQRRPSDVVAITPLPGWFVPSGSEPIRCSKDTSGVVHITGVVANTNAFTPAPDAAMFILPGNHRPSQVLFGVLSMNTGTSVARADVRPDGNVVLIGAPVVPVPAGTVFGLSALAFYAG